MPLVKQTDAELLAHPAEVTKQGREHMPDTHRRRRRTPRRHDRSVSGELPIILLCWQGTGSDMWNTTPPQPASVASVVAQALPNIFYFQPIGNWPAQLYPMGPSVDEGYNEGVRLATKVHPNNLLFPFGYSQGAICASHFLRNFIIPNNLQNRVAGGITFGNPCRSPGIANGNAWADWPMPGNIDGFVTGGISGPDCLTAAQTPSWWLDFVNTTTSDHGETDLYANCPVGTDPWTAEAPPGKVGTSIYNVVQQATVLDVVAVAADLAVPIGTVEEIVNGFEFLAAQGAADHYTYPIQPAIDYLTNVIAPQHRELNL